MLIPLSDEVKGRCDIGAIGTAAAAFFKAIPWPELAAFAAFIYTLLRIIEVLHNWNKRK